MSGLAWFAVLILIAVAGIALALQAEREEDSIQAAEARLRAAEGHLVEVLRGGE